MKKNKIPSHDGKKHIIERNMRHLNKAQGTPCTIEPLQSLLELVSRTTFGNIVLDRTVNLTQLPLTKLQQLYWNKKLNCRY